MDSGEHGKVVLAAILRGRKDLLQAALRHLDPGHFADPTQRGIYTMCERYLDIAGEVLPKDALGDILREANQPPGTVLAYEEYHAYLCSIEATEADFRWSVAQLRELAAAQLTGEALAAAMEILRKGRQEGKRTLQGHQDARAWLLAEIARIERELHAADAPEGDMRLEVRDIAAEYAARKQAVAAGTAFISTSVPELDEALGGGIAAGELALMAGFTTAGKTSWCVSLVHHAVVAQHKNVLLFTSETLRSQIRVKILARHSRQPQFGLPEGLNSKAIKGALLDEAGKHAFAAVLNDWKDGDYGRCHIAQVPRGATMDIIEARMRRMASAWRADLVVVDYLQLLRSGERFATQREAQGQVVKDAKEVAATYLDGQGVPLISPWQMSRAARDNARGGAGYNLTGLSETNEASSTPDVIMSLLEPDDYTGGRRTRLRLQILKGRDGERGRDIYLDVDYATCFFAAQSGNSYDTLASLEEEMA